MPPIIDVQNLSKKYKIGAAQPRYLSLRDSLSSTFKRAKDLTTFKKLSNLNTDTEFWALKDINFQVNAGESIGIIGRNGAGKSTLLKILSRITPPTSGGAILRGRLASLLEVGTGFHPELTGRENVYFNGSILGLRKAEIDRKFDEIVDFSGVERFIDTPLKNYSSGMQLRLAFAVAAHLEPEILIIDEVLAVGDAEFQKKCLGKMDEVSKSGRTVIFVSHQLGTIAQLCSKTCLLQSGTLIMMDDTSKVISYYLSEQNISNIFIGSKNRKQYAYIEEIKVVDENGQIASAIEHDKPIGLQINVKINEFKQGLSIGIALINALKQRVFTVNLSFADFTHKSEKDKNFIFSIPAHTIMPGHYSWVYALHLSTVEYFEDASDICSFKIIDNGSEFAKSEGGDNGCIFMHNYSIISL